MEKIQTENKLFQEINPYKPKTRTPKKVLDRNDFMLLFVKQLQYQDPMNPLENNEMATQLALFNQLDELYALNEKFNKLIEVNKINSFYTYASMIGKIVEIEGNEALVKNGNFLGAKIILDEPISNLKIKIVSLESGKTVKNLDLGALSPGEHLINWDATDENGEVVPDGTYILSLSYDDKNFPGKLIVSGEISSVSFEEKNPFFMFNGTKKIDISEVKSIKENIVIPNKDNSQQESSNEDMEEIK